MERIVEQYGTRIFNLLAMSVSQATLDLKKEEREKFSDVIQLLNEMDDNLTKALSEV